MLSCSMTKTVPRLAPTREGWRSVGNVRGQALTVDGGAYITDQAKGDLNEDEGRSAMGAQCSVEC
jgi:hypothetical protein